MNPVLEHNMAMYRNLVNLCPQRIQWLGHVERMDETAMPKRMLKGKLYQTRRIGGHRIRWLEDVIADLRRMAISGWMEKARNRD